MMQHRLPHRWATSFLHTQCICIYIYTTRWRGRSWIMSWDSRGWRLSWRCLACRRSTYQPNVSLSPPPRSATPKPRFPPSNQRWVHPKPTNAHNCPRPSWHIAEAARGEHESGYAHSYPLWRIGGGGGGGEWVRGERWRVIDSDGLKEDERNAMIKKEIGLIFIEVECCILQKCLL